VGEWEKDEEIYFSSVDLSPFPLSFFAFSPLSPTRKHGIFQLLSPFRFPSVSPLPPTSLETQFRTATPLFYGFACYRLLADRVKKLGEKNWIVQQMLINHYCEILWLLHFLRPFFTFFSIYHTYCCVVCVSVCVCVCVWLRALFFFITIYTCSNRTIGLVQLTGQTDGLSGTVNFFFFLLNGESVYKCECTVGSITLFNTTMNLQYPTIQFSPLSHSIMWHLALAAGSVLSVLQCPPPPPVLRASSLLRPCSPVNATAAAAAMSTTSTSTTSIGTAGDEPLMHFLRNICVKAAVTELALVISLIYVDRLKKVLTNMARGDPDTPFKIILSALLVVKKVSFRPIEQHHAHTHTQKKKSRLLLDGRRGRKGEKEG